MIDWELLGSRQHDRVEVWRQAYKDTQITPNISFALLVIGEVIVT